MMDVRQPCPGCGGTGRVMVPVASAIVAALPGSCGACAGSGLGVEPLEAVIDAGEAQAGDSDAGIETPPVADPEPEPEPEVPSAVQGLALPRSRGGRGSAKPSVDESEADRPELKAYLEDLAE